MSGRGPLLEYVINHWPIQLSFFYNALLRLRGIRVGKGVRFLGGVRVKIRGKAENIIIGHHVVLGNNVDLRNRENGKIILKDRVYLDDAVRLVAAREGRIEIGFGTNLGRNTMVNSGGITLVGEYVMMGPNVNINSSAHGMEKERFVKEQPHIHGKIEIGNDVFIGAAASILMNSKIGDGAIVSSNSLVNGEIPAFGVCMGVPARLVRNR